MRSPTWKVLQYTTANTNMMWMARLDGAAMDGVAVLCFNFFASREEAEAFASAHPIESSEYVQVLLLLSTETVVMRRTRKGDPYIRLRLPQ